MNNNIKITYQSLFNYFYIIITLLWQPLQQTIFNVDGQGRILFSLTIIAMLLNMQYRSFRRVAFSKPSVIWFIWCIYIMINAIFQGYSTNLPIQYFFVLKIISPYVIMTVAAYEYTKNDIRFLKSMLATFVAYAIIGSVFMDISYMAIQDGRTAENSLGNLLALNTIFVTFFASLLCNRKVIKTRTFYLLIAIAGAIITLSATRKAFGAVFIIYAFYLFSQIKPTAGNIIKYLVLFVIIYIGIDYIINNTYIGERFTEIEDSAEQFVDTDNPLLKMLGDRALFYVTGWQIFLDNTLFGIGLTNYATYSKTDIYIHSEYIVQLCECGIVGSILYVLFYASIISNIFKNRKSKSSSIIMIGAILAILFISLTAWTYDFPFYFVIIGTVIGYTKRQSANYTQRSISQTL